jgi:hypothetical protein
MRIMLHALGVLADRWRHDPRFDGVVAAHGTNLFPEHARNGGFEVRELRPAWRRKLLSWYVRRIVAGAHPQGRERVVLNGRPREVKELWLSRGMCLRHFGGGRTPVAEQPQSEEELPG